MTASAILWDVVAEHLDELEFLLELRGSALESPVYSLDDLIAGPDARVAAHLDGLVVGGDDVARELLVPALEEADDPLRAAAVATALLAQPQPSWSQPLLDRLPLFADGTRLGITHALGLGTRVDLEPRIQAVWSRAAPEHRPAYLPALTQLRVDPGRALDDLLRADDPEVRAGALQAARFADRGRYLAWIEQATLDRDPVVARAATATGLCFGSKQAWAAAAARARDTNASDREAMVAVAMLGDASVVSALSARLSADDPGRSDAVWALGFSGWLEGARICFGLLGDADVGALAAEAFAGITGLPRDDDLFWLDAAAPDETDASEGDDLPPLDEDLANDLAPDPPEAELPLPRVDAISEWWAKNEARFDAKTRYVLGLPATGATLVRALGIEPLRRRHVLAHELELRSKGAARLDSRALGPTQRRQLGTLSGLPPIDANRPFSRIG